MPPQLRILAGPTATELQPVSVNDDENPFIIDTDEFQGRITVRVKDFHKESSDQDEESTTAPYFSLPYGNHMTYSIQIQGRFLHEVSANDLVFGNQFDQPIRDHLPYGTSVALRFISVVDPTLKHDLYSDQPWAFSPLLATMYRVKADRVSTTAFEDCTSATECFASSAWPAFPDPKKEEDYLSDNISPLFYKHIDEDSEPSLLEDLDLDENGVKQLNEKHNVYAFKQRAAWLRDARRREKLLITPHDVITSDFCNGYIDFNTLQLVIPYGGLRFDLQKYWDGQPVRYVCKNAATDQVYFVVQFELVAE